MIRGLNESENSTSKKILMIPLIYWKIILCPRKNPKVNHKVSLEHFKVESHHECFESDVEFRNPIKFLLYGNDYKKRRHEMEYFCLFKN